MNKLKVCENVYIDKIYVINLYFQVELKKEMIDQLTKYNLINYVVWIDAVYNSKNPAYGCSLSHHKAYKDMKDNNYDACMILEDDCILKEFPFKIEEPINENWGLLYGGYLCYEEKSYKYNKSFLRLIDARSSHCYIINKTILNYVKQMTLIENIPIDIRLIHPVQKAVPCYGFYPIKAHQKPHKSTTCPHEFIITDWEKIMNDKAFICYNNLITDELLEITNSWNKHYKITNK
jgi:hypothetical protein